MSHKITFLGSAGDIKTAGKIYSSGGIVINTEGYQFQIDPGISSLSTAREAQVNLRDNDVVICTNNNLVSCNDLNAVIDYMSLEGEDKHGVLVGAVSVINGSNDENPILKETTRKHVEKIIGLKPDDKVGLGDVDITAKKVNSPDDNGIGVLIEAPVFRLGYVPTSGFSVTNAKQFEKVDILILSVKNPSSVTEAKSMNIKEAVQFIDLAKPRLAIITNLGFKLSKDTSVKIIREVQKETKVQTMVASPGLVINASSYKAVKQEKLD